jgi:hypothetical protein
VELRSCWADEARNLTPWIASEPGLALLGKALDMELSCENCEVPVGPFNADILARDLTTDSLVVIENQLERTNHDHFGKTLTYAAVLGAKTECRALSLFRFVGPLWPDHQPVTAPHALIGRTVAELSQKRILLSQLG